MPSPVLPSIDATLEVYCESPARAMELSDLVFDYDPSANPRMENAGTAAEYRVCRLSYTNDSVPSSNTVTWQGRNNGTSPGEQPPEGSSLATKSLHLEFPTVTVPMTG
jgi:hypothetical protein